MFVVRDLRFVRESPAITIQSIRIIDTSVEKLLVFFLCVKRSCVGKKEKVYGTVWIGTNLIVNQLLERRMKHEKYGICYDIGSFSCIGRFWVLL